LSRFCCAGNLPESWKDDLSDPAVRADLELRREASRCYDMCQQDYGLACVLFRKRNPDHDQSNVSEYIHTWVYAVDKRYTLHTPKSPGRKEKITEPQVKRAIRLLWEGYTVNGLQRYYSSIRDAATQCAGIRKILDDTGITKEHLLQRMKALDSRVRKTMQRIKRVLTDANKKQRCDDSRALLQWAVERLYQVFWVDAATIQIIPKDHMVYAPPGAPNVVEDPRLPSHSRKVPKLKFYICINAILGPVALEFVTGTTGLMTEEQWLVSAGQQWQGRLGLGGGAGRGPMPPCCWLGRMPCTTQSCTVAAPAPSSLLPAHACASMLHPGGASAAGGGPC
jgi:hypothetical protein